MQKHVNLVDLLKSFPTNILLQNLASIQKRASPIKLAHLAEKSENGSISNLSTKAHTAANAYPGPAGWSAEYGTQRCADAAPRQNASAIRAYVGQMEKYTAFVAGLS